MKECIICGTVFSTRIPRALCCSAECSRQRHRNLVRISRAERASRKRIRLQSRACVVCNNDFLPRIYRALCCSAECRQKYRNRGPECRMRFMRNRSGRSEAYEDELIMQEDEKYQTKHMKATAKLLVRLQRHHNIQDVRAATIGVGGKRATKL